MSDSVNPVTLTPQGPPNTILPEPSAEERHLLEQARSVAPDSRRESLATVVRRFPRSPEAWSRLGDAVVDPVERYAYYRIGYHRGLDALRQNGWRGSGYVLWKHESNRGFLRSLRGLMNMAVVIGETDEAERCSLFLRQLDPHGVPDE